MFGKRLRELREKSGLTMKELGAIWQLSESAVSMYERYKREPTYAQLVEFAKYFDVSLDYLFGNEEYHIVINRLRIEAKISLEDMAEKFEISLYSYMLIELGELIPDYTTHHKIIDYWGADRIGFCKYSKNAVAPDDANFFKKDINLDKMMKIMRQLSFKYQNEIISFAKFKQQEMVSPPQLE